MANMGTENTNNNAVLRMLPCHQCGKSFIPQALHSYKKHDNKAQKVYYFCSYCCYTTYEKAHVTKSEIKRQKQIERELRGVR